MVSGFLSCFELKSALAELRSATGGFEAVLLAFLHSRIAGEEPGLLQHGRRFSPSNCSRARAMPWRMAPAWPVTPPPATRQTMSNLSVVVGECQRLTDDQLQGLEAEIIIDVSVVDGDLAGALVNADAGNGALSSAGAVEIRRLSRTSCLISSLMRSQASGFWAACLCSASPADTDAAGQSGAAQSVGRQPCP